MWHQLMIPFLIPTLIIKSNCDDNNKTDTVFVRYGTHADAEYQDPTTITIKTTESTTTTEASTTTVKMTDATTTKFVEEATEDVVFVPNKAPEVVRDEEEYDGRGLRIKDIMIMKTVNDAMNKDFHVEKDIDDPNEDVVFITGKNHDIENAQPEDNTRRKNSNKHYEQTDDLEEEIIQTPRLNCNNLNCNNTMSSICGAKFINNEWRYRLFLNDCYFRKVNCGFKYEINRHIHNERNKGTSYPFGGYKRDGYKLVEFEKCNKIGAHYIERPFSFKPKQYIYKQELKPESDSRRSSSSRRSMTKNYNGEFCSHVCPLTCPDDYDPQCAISGTGQHRVFLNHCRLDLNSCFYSVVWHKRPLSECVGGKKADMRQNRGFIGWMQRVGIVDRTGRLVLE